MTIISQRAVAANGAFDAVKNFYFNSRYGERRTDPGIADFTFGNPHEMPLEGIVAAIREGAVPQNEDWFAYKTSEEAPPGFSRQGGRQGARPSIRSSRTSPSPPAPSRQSRSRFGSCSMPVTRRSTPSRPGSVTNRCCSPPMPFLARWR